MKVELDYKPTQIQKLFHLSSCDEVLFGGAAGGGKSTAIVMDAIDRCLRTPKIDAYLFRRTYRELNDTLIAMAKRILPSSIFSYNSSNYEFVFPNGSIMRFRHLNDKQDIYKYQGAQINLLYIDELTHFKKYEYDFLKSRLRIEKKKKYKPLVRATSNPGGRGHAWVKSYFVDAAPFNQPYVVNVESSLLKSSKLYSRIYIPAKVMDNPYISEDYIYQLEQKPDGLKNALLYGKWDAFEGQVFCEWTDDPAHYDDLSFTHVINPFKIPEHWPRFRSFDFGYSKPFAVLWWAVGERDEIYLYREWYGKSAPNTGIKLSAKDIARGILQRDGGDSIECSFADPSIWDGSRGESIYLQMEKEGISFLKGENARIAGKMAIHQRLKFDSNGRPSLYVFNTCRDFIRTVPSLEYDINNPEDIDTDGEDHIYDATRYFVMQSVKGKVKPKPLSGPFKFNPLADDVKKSGTFLSS